MSGRKKLAWTGDSHRRHEDDGTRTLLTATPVVETDYEYDLYKRATALYPACPSDGYELLRFGRILSSPATLMSSSANPSAGTASLNAQAVNQCATWFLVTWSAGLKAISISATRPYSSCPTQISRLLPGWEKIGDGHTPFDHDGLCDVERLKNFLKDAKERQEFAAILGRVLLDTVDLGHSQVLRYPPLAPLSHPVLCSTFPPATVPFSESITINHVPQVP